MILNKIKQNLAGLAVVALAFTGLSAIAPATASNVGALADPERGFDVYQNFTMSGATGTAVTPASARSPYFSTTVTVTSAGSAALASGALTMTMTGTGPNGAISWQADGYMNTYYAYPPGSSYVGSNAGTLTWPASTSGNSGYLSYSWYDNYSPLPAGTYTLTAELKKNGVVVPFTSDIAVSMNVRYNLATSSVVTGGGVSANSWRSGYVCVDMAGISAGDTLAAQVTANGADTNAGSFEWTTNGWSNIGNSSSLTVPASAITAGQIVLHADLMSSITSGAAYDVNIKKGAVEVSKSCEAGAATVAPTVTVSGSGMGGVTFTGTISPVSGASLGYDCYLYDANNVEQFSNFVAAGGTSCQINAWGALNSASYTMKYRARGILAGALSPASAAILPVTATFDANGGTGTPPAAITHWGSFTLPSAGSLTRSGYNFAGWATTANSNSWQSVGNNATASVNTTFYAIWNQMGGGFPTCSAPMSAVNTSISDLGTGNSYTMYFNNDPTMTNCTSPQIANGGVRATLNGNQIGTPIYSGSIGFTLTSASRTLTSLLAGPNFSGVTVHDGDVYTVSYYRNLSATPTASDVPFASFSLRLWPTVANPGQNQIQNNNVQQQQVTPTLPTNVPLVSPIAVPQAGFKPGGALVLDGRNMSAVTSVKVGSTATTTVKTASGIEVKVPTDLAPGAHDLLVATATGSTLFVGAVKVADPAVVAAKEAVAKAAASILYRAPIDLTVGKTVSSAQAAAAKNFASQYRNAKSAVCIAIPATKATASAALAAANKVCATFKTQIRGIRTTVVLGAPSGDKVNRVSAEVQG